jgi:hypothetical protein
MPQLINITQENLEQLAFKLQLCYFDMTYQCRAVTLKLRITQIPYLSFDYNAFAIVHLIYSKTNDKRNVNERQVYLPVTAWI